MIIIFIVFLSGLLYGNTAGDRLEIKSRNNSNKALFACDYRVTCKPCPRFIRRPEHEIKEIVRLVCQELNHKLPLINPIDYRNRQYGYALKFNQGLIYLRYDFATNECHMDFIHFSDSCLWVEFMTQMISMVRLSERNDVQISFAVLPE